jgi:hypothetical protein
MPAAPGDSCPPCGNITNGDGSYTGIPGETGTVDFIIQLQAPACLFVNYSLVVTDTTGNRFRRPARVRTAVCTAEASGGGCVHFTYSIAGTPDPVCIYTTTAINDHVVDHAPNVSDLSCTGPEPSISISLGNAAAGGNFN